MTVFDGTAREAARAFPRNMNVAGALSLAGIGFDETRVTIAADPTVRRNTHRVDIEGDFGTATVEIANVPHEDNPRSSRLAAMSALSTLRRLGAAIQIG
jgi:aspartate dehydrogenase